MSPKATQQRQTKWGIGFEENVRSSLTRWGFKDVSGGPTFEIGGSGQLDAVGGIDKTLFIIDCYHPRDGAGSVRDKIRTIRGVARTVERGMRRSKKYKKYSRVQSIVAVRGQVSATDRKQAGNYPEVVLLDHQTISYYDKLATTVGPSVLWEMLGDLGIPPRRIQLRNAKLPAFRLRIGTRRMYVFAASVRDLQKIAYVSRRERGREKHYQRMLRREKIEDIKKFIDDGRRHPFFANNIIVSFDKDPKFRALKKSGSVSSGILQLPNAYRCARVIDGQHRLYGSGAAKRGSEMVVPVAALVNFSIDQEAELFLNINDKQTPIPSNLIWALETEIHPSSEMGRIGQVVVQLAEKAPMNKLVDTPGRVVEGKRPLKFGNLCESIRALHLLDERTPNTLHKRKNPLWKRSAEKTVKTTSKAIRSFWVVIANEFPDGVMQFRWSNEGGSNWHPFGRATSPIAMDSRCFLADWPTCAQTKCMESPWPRNKEDSGSFMW